MALPHGDFDGGRTLLNGSPDPLVELLAEGFFLHGVGGLGGGAGGVGSRTSWSSSMAAVMTA